LVDIKKSESSDSLSSTSIVRNISYNLLSYILPLILAVIFLPILIRGIGDEKFGILNIAWIVIGYFSFLDFGISRALTKIISEKNSKKETDEIPAIFWTSIILMLAISIISTIILLFGSEYIVYHFFKISPQNRVESLHTLYLLALSLPIVITSAGLRGFLEAYYRFKIISVTRIILGIGTFTGPAIVLLFTTSLSWMICSMIIFRIITWLLFIHYTFKENGLLKKKIEFQISKVKMIFRLSFWMTISNIFSPLLIYMDRFFIGSVISAAAITYYATPFEVVTKILLVPGAIIGVLFPAFSASYATDSNYSFKLFTRSVKFTQVLIFPVILFIITFSSEILTLWLGNKFATESSLILQLLAAGVLLNSLAYIPFTFIQGIGKPDFPAKLLLIEIPIYGIMLWISVKGFGIKGVAMVWLIRMILDTLILFIYSTKVILAKKWLFQLIGVLILILVVLIIPIFLKLLLVKIMFFIIIMGLFVYLNLTYVFTKDEKSFLIKKLLSVKATI